MMKLHEELRVCPPESAGRAEEGMTGPEGRDRTAVRVAAQLSLILGGALIVLVCALTLRNLTDHTVLTLTVPGFLVGIALIVPYIVVGGQCRPNRQADRR